MAYEFTGMTVLKLVAFSFAAGLFVGIVIGVLIGKF
jgi:F0F1-type ATP synthase assembly protein I